MCCVFALSQEKKPESFLHQLCILLVVQALIFMSFTYSCNQGWQCGTVRFTVRLHFC